MFVQALAACGERPDPEMLPLCQRLDSYALVSAGLGAASALLMRAYPGDARRIALDFVVDWAQVLSSLHDRRYDLAPVAVVVALTVLISFIRGGARLSAAGRDKVMLLVEMSYGTTIAVCAVWMVVGIAIDTGMLFESCMLDGAFVVAIMGTLVQLNRCLHDRVLFPPSPA